MLNKLIILGAGGSSREIASAVRDCDPAGSRWELIGFLDDKVSLIGTFVEDLPILGGVDSVAAYPDCLFILGIARYDVPELRKSLIAKLGLPPERYATIIHPKACVSSNVVVGPGCAIFPGAVISPGVFIGKHVIVSQQTVLAHDVTVADYATIAPGVIACGNVTIGESAYLGARATIAPSVTVGEEALVGIGSTVLRSVSARTTVMGNPAIVISTREAAARRWVP